MRYSDYEQRQLDVESGAELDRVAAARNASTSAHAERVEVIARALAAAMMGLVKDPTGAKLPGDCWKQMVPKATALLFIASGDRSPYDPINNG